MPSPSPFPSAHPASSPPPFPQLPHPLLTSLPHSRCRMLLCLTVPRAGPGSGKPNAIVPHACPPRPPIDTAERLKLLLHGCEACRQPSAETSTSCDNKQMSTGRGFPRSPPLPRPPPTRGGQGRGPRGHARTVKGRDFFTATHPLVTRGTEPLAPTKPPRTVAMSLSQAEAYNEHGRGHHTI